MVIRVLGSLVGLLFIIAFGYMLCMESGLLNILSSLSGLLLGVIFLIYGIGGKESLSKILPRTANTNVTK